MKLLSTLQLATLLATVSITTGPQPAKEVKQVKSRVRSKDVKI